jgi:hypothetical protein
MGSMTERDRGGDRKIHTEREREREREKGRARYSRLMKDSIEDWS